MSLQRQGLQRGKYYDFYIKNWSQILYKYIVIITFIRAIQAVSIKYELQEIQRTSKDKDVIKVSKIFMEQLQTRKQYQICGLFSFNTTLPAAVRMNNKNYWEMLATRSFSSVYSWWNHFLYVPVHRIRCEICGSSSAIFGFESLRTKKKNTSQCVINKKIKELSGETAETSKLLPFSGKLCPYMNVVH